MRLRSLYACLVLAPTLASPALAPSTAEPPCCKPAPYMNLRPQEPIPFDDLPLEDAITLFRGDGTRPLAVFQDPECRYSKRLERELQQLDNVTIYVLLYPVRSERSKATADAVWCSPDRAKAWLDVMLGDATLPVVEVCDSPIDRLIDFGMSNDVRGTPTLVFENGDLVAGALTAAQIEERLTKAALIRLAGRG